MFDSIDSLLTSMGYGPSSYQPGGALSGSSASSGGFDWGGLGAAGIGGLIGAFGGGSSGSSQPQGYQGGIPQYTASREYYAAPSDRVPGSAGRSYFSDVVFTPVEPAPAPAPTTPSQEDDSQYDWLTDNDNQGGMAAGGYLRRYASGGLGSLGGYSDGGQMLKGPGTGQSDDIPATIEGEQPARLARDEFVIPADVVSMLGDGSSDAGAERLYAMMDRIRKAAHGREKQQNKINPNRVLPA